MKRILFLLTVGLIHFAAQSQNYDDIKGAVAIKQFKKAKDDLDKSMSNAKFAGKPEAYVLKATIYSNLALENGTKNTPAGDQLANDADVAFQKYKSMEASMDLVKDPVYQYAPLNLYYAYYFSGYNDYDNKKWAEGFGKLKKAVDYSDLLISKQILNISVDTNVLILAGVTAENSNNKDEAVKYYSRLADAKIAGKDYESVYRYLVIYYFGKKDMANFEKYKALGAQLYPKSDYFKYDKVDFAIGLMDKFEDKLKAVEEVLVTDPNNMKANDLLWGLIYDALYPEKDETPVPANAAELEPKMIAAIQKAVAAKPDNETPYIFWGNHLIVKKDRIVDARQKHADDMKARTKPGTMASKEDIAKRDLLDKQYFDAMDAIREPYEKAAKIFGAKPSLDIKQKGQYRNISGYLAEIYELKKKKAKAGSPEQKAFEAEETKWNQVYDSIKN